MQPRPGRSICLHHDARTPADGGRQLPSSDRLASTMFRTQQGACLSGDAVQGRE